VQVLKCGFCNICGERPWFNAHVTRVVSPMCFRGLELQPFCPISANRKSLKTFTCTQTMHLWSVSYGACRTSSLYLFTKKGGVTISVCYSSISTIYQSLLIEVSLKQLTQWCC